MVSFWADVFWVTGVGFCRECRLCRLLVFHSGSIITGVGEGWKGLSGLEQYISCMFGVVFSFQWSGLSEPGWTRLAGFSG